MKFKAVVLDMDGTLLKRDHSIGEYTKETIKQLLDKGIKVCIATGRAHTDAMTFKNDLGLSSYLISSNGARVHDENDNEIIAHDIDPDLTNKILNLDINPNIHRNIFLGDSWFVEKDMEGLLEFHAHSGFKFDIIDFNTLRGKSVTKFFFLNDDLKTILDLERQVIQLFKLELSIALSSSNCLEIMAMDVNKGRAVQEITNLLGITLADTLVFGDGMNDYEMLALAGKGFLMEEANPRLRRLLPTYPVIGNCNDEAVAKKLREIYTDIF